MTSTVCKCLRWAFRLPDWEPNRAEWLQVLQSIQEEEIVKINRFMFRDDSKSTAVGRLMMRASLVHLLNIPWSQLRLGRTEKGKPILTAPTGVQQCPGFSITHHGDYVLLATDCGPSCGVDVMKIEFRSTKLHETVSDYLNLMRRQFSAKEWRTMQQAPSDMEKLNLFYRYWCLKESYLKAIGSGIHNDLASVDFRFDNDDPSTFKPNLWLQGHCVSDQWHFAEYKIDSNHVAAVCTPTSAESNCRRRSGENLTFENVTISDLLKNAHPIHDVDENFYNLFIGKAYKNK